jgi:hypothetical protein
MGEYESRPVSHCPGCLPFPQKRPKNASKNVKPATHRWALAAQRDCGMKVDARLARAAAFAESLSRYSPRRRLLRVPFPQIPTEKCCNLKEELK